MLWLLKDDKSRHFEEVSMFSVRQRKYLERQMQQQVYLQLLVCPSQSLFWKYREYRSGLPSTILAWAAYRIVKYRTTGKIPLPRKSTVHVTKMAILWSRSLKEIFGSFLMPDSILFVFCMQLAGLFPSSVAKYFKKSKEKSTDWMVN
jgi:hypothetical protein